MLPSGVHGSGTVEPGTVVVVVVVVLVLVVEDESVGSHTTGVSDAPPFGPFGPWSETPAVWLATPPPIRARMATPASHERSPRRAAGRGCVPIHDRQKAATTPAGLSAGRVRRTVAGRLQAAVRSLSCAEATQQAEQLEVQPDQGHEEAEAGEPLHVLRCGLGEHRAR